MKLRKEYPHDFILLSIFYMTVAFVIILLMVVFISSGEANSDYSAGSGFGKQISGSGKNSIKTFDPSTAVEGYTANPPEKGYWPGTTGTSTSIGEKGAEQLANSESGKTIADSIVNNPTDNISMDAPFLENGLTAKKNAEAITGGTGDFCTKHTQNFITFTRHVCNRDVNVQEVCTRSSSLTGSWRDITEIKYITIQPTDFTYSQNGSTMYFSFQSPVSGTINSATMSLSPYGLLITKTTGIFNSTYSGSWLNPVTLNLNAAGIGLTQGQTVSGYMTFMNSSLAGGATNSFNGCKGSISITMMMTVPGRVWDPRVEWSEFCPFSKTDGVLAKTECIEAGGNKTVYMDGKPYVIYQGCWAYRDTYITQSATEGSCGQFASSPACTVVGRGCDAYSEDAGYCINEAVTYECEKVTKAEGMLCGGDFFCSDGLCEQVKQGKDNGFKQAVSQLAAVAAAGDDVAELNNSDIKAFTGKGQTCRKTAVGFSNCCKDSGWGHDIGLSSCNSEEKALGEAKGRKLTVDIGEYCSKKVLGVCLEKKRAYCVFDSKLAQIVQQQGRKWQLGISFGSAKSPNCRGITIDELVSIKFDNLDFRNFYDDLESGLEIPEENELMQRVQEQIKEEIGKKSQGAAQ